MNELCPHMQILMFPCTCSTFEVESQNVVIFVKRTTQQ